MLWNFFTAWHNKLGCFDLTIINFDKKCWKLTAFAIMFDQVEMDASILFIQQKGLLIWLLFSWVKYQAKFNPIIYNIVFAGIFG